MTAPKVDDHKNFARALVLLRENPDCQACLKFAHNAGWNFARLETHLMAYAMWNAYLPNRLKINYDAFEDKGVTPEHMTRHEMEKIQKLEGVTNDPMKKGFQPFYFWTFGIPKQSPKYIKQQQEIEKEKAKYYEKYQPSERRMEHQRYWGD
jgi:hypothetical protein